MEGRRSRMPWSSWATPRRRRDAGDGRAARPAVRQPQRNRHPPLRRRTGARVGRPRKRRHAARRRRRHHRVIVTIRWTTTRSTSCGSSSTGRSKSPWPRGKRSSRPSTGTTARSETESVDSMLQEFTDTAIDFTETATASGRSATRKTVDEGDAPVVRLVQLIIQEAVQLRASDIHIEPFEDRIRVRYRIDGVLVERDSPPRRLLGAICPASRSWLNSTLPSAAAPRTAASRSPSAKRTSTCASASCRPTTASRSSCGFWTRTTSRSGLRSWASARTTTERFKNLIQRPNGIILVTGPTGSGKTTIAVRGPERTEHAGPEDHHGRGPGRVLPAGGEPGRDSARHWAGLSRGSFARCCVRRRM